MREKKIERMSKMDIQCGKNKLVLFKELGCYDLHSILNCLVLSSISFDLDIYFLVTTELTEKLISSIIRMFT